MFTETKFVTKMRTNICILDSLTDQVDKVLEKQPNVRIWDPWVGKTFESWEKVVDAIQTVWPEGMRVYDNMMNQLHDEHIPPPKSLKRNAVWSDEEGDEVDLDRLRSGQTYLRTTRRQHRPGPLSITLICNLKVPGHIDSYDVLWRAAGSVCLIELLERSGYRVELWGTMYGSYMYNSANGLVAVCYKRGNDPLDRVSLVNSLSGWSLRTIFFGSCYLAARDVSSGYGTPKSIKGIEKEITQDEQAIVCEDIWSHSQAVTWVRNEIAKLK